MIWLLAVGLIAGLIGIAWIAGRQGAKKDVLSQNVKVKDKQLKAANDRPARDDLSRRMRDDKW